MNAGGSNATIDDFNTNWAFDRAPHEFVGGYNVSGGFNTPLPIGYRPVPAGTPQWGSEWKRATAKWYQTAMVINASGSVMANRYNCYDLDPTYRNAFGQPLMRMTFDYRANEHKMGIHAAADHQRHRQIDEPDQAQPGCRAHRTLDRGALSKHPQYRRLHHGDQPARKRGQQILTELGLSQPVRSRSQCVPAQFRHTTRPDLSARWPIGPPMRSRTAI